MHIFAFKASYHLFFVAKREGCLVASLLDDLHILLYLVEKALDHLAVVGAFTFFCKLFELTHKTQLLYYDVERQGTTETTTKCISVSYTNHERNDEFGKGDVSRLMLE